MNKNENLSPLDEHLSFIRHELRSKIIVIHEAVSQVTDGLCGKDCDKCRATLDIALKNTKKLYDVIDSLLDEKNFLK